MNHLWVFLLNSLVLWYLLLPGRAQAQCPKGNPGMTQSQLSQFLATAGERIKVLEGLESNLEKLRQGVPISLPPANLFLVALNDKDAIEKRVAGLKLELAQPPRESRSSLPYLDPCFDHSKGDGAPGAHASEALRTLDRLDSLERRVSHLRLDFLSLPEIQRTTLLDLQSQVMSSQKQLQKSDLEIMVATQTALIAETARKKAESQAQSSEDGPLADLATQRAILEQYRQDLAAGTIEINQRLSKIVEESKQQTAQLTKAATVLTRPDASQEDLSAAYNEVITLWRKLVDHTFRGTHPRSIPIPDLPPVPVQLLDQLGDQKVVQDYRATYQDVLKEEQKLRLAKSHFDEERVGFQDRVLLQVGAIRARFIYEWGQKKAPFVFNVSNGYFTDLLRELRLIPYRPWVSLQMRLIENRDLVESGIGGILTLVNRFLLLSMFMLTPFLSYWALRRLSQILDRLRTWLLDPQHRGPYAMATALWIRRINPFLPWIIMSLGAHIAAWVVTGTDLAALVELLPFLYYYFVYKMFLLLVDPWIVALSKSTERDGVPLDMAQRLAGSARLVGRFLLLAASVLHATQSIARTGLVYHLVWDLVRILLPLLLAATAYSWRLELGQRATELFGSRVGRTLNNWCQSRFKGLVASPATALAIAGNMAFWRLYRDASQFESTKKLSAQIFRRRLEAAAAREGVADPMITGTEAQQALQSYSRFFKPGSESPPGRQLLMVPQGLDLAKIGQTIDDWRIGISDERTMIIQGIKGSGKSTVLSLIEAQCPSVAIRRLAIPNKVLDPQALRSLLGKTLATDLSQGESSLVTFAQKTSKTLLLLDDCQNLFLAEQGGFAAFEEFISLTRSDTKNLFWCAAFNRYSWSYLNAVTKGSGSCRSVITLNHWCDDDIKKMILRRHQASGYSLDYDPQLFRAKSLTSLDQHKGFQDRFFQLLWEQSKGNPRAAIDLWLSALGVRSRTSLRVSLPAPTGLRHGDTLSDDDLFVFAAIMRHENLTLEEAQKATNLPENMVRRALGAALENETITVDTSRRYRMRPLWQAALTQQLINKNFVYE